tara:strand:+ start:1739 stop:1984 length:246 start_codon:yes stop_codon:yes gene_type:complete
VRASKGERELSPEESVALTDIEALARQLYREVFFLPGDNRQSRRELKLLLVSDPGHFLAEMLHDSGGKKMHPEKAQVIPGS